MWDVILGEQHMGVTIKLRRVIVHYVYYGFYYSQRVFAEVDGSYLFAIEFTRVTISIIMLLMAEVDGLLEEVSVRRRVVAAV